MISGQYNLIFHLWHASTCPVISTLDDIAIHSDRRPVASDEVPFWRGDPIVLLCWLLIIVVLIPLQLGRIWCSLEVAHTGVYTSLYPPACKYPPPRDIRPVAFQDPSDSG
ncbi:hypothetical protein AcV5_008107 [Taiwanofungus camphoratus]|nr:hypothetical protein AcV5_008107 [Antrodia cinnamomea]KAI0930919.1 hypothetical protein AcV7_004967 [Antrodia cinnamomea]